MKDARLTIENNRMLKKDIFELTLRGDVSDIERPGQFVNLKLEGLFLRRPISVCDLEGDRLTLLYKVVGAGTEQLSRMSAGEAIDTLTGLGNGFDLSKAGVSPLLLGGGMGCAPLYFLAKRLLAEGVKPAVVMGFGSEREAVYEEKFKALGVRTLITTADGSAGIKGFVTDGLSEAGSFDYTYACGPEPMLKAIYNAAACDGQYSFEARMGCGFGACMGCSCKTKYGSKRICKDGPVLERGEIVW